MTENPCTRNVDTIPIHRVRYNVYGLYALTDLKDAWFGRLEETIHGAKRLITSHEGYLWKKGQMVSKWKKRYFALSKGWLFYFEEQFHCNKFKSIAFFSEAFFNQAFRLYVKGSIPLHQTTIQKVETDQNMDTSNAPGPDVNGDEEEHYRHSFKIITQKREFEFATETAKDLERWFRAFHSTHNPLGVECTSFYPFFDLVFFGVIYVISIYE